MMTIKFIGRIWEVMSFQKAGESYYIFYKNDQDEISVIQMNAQEFKESADILK